MTTPAPAFHTLSLAPATTTSALLTDEQTAYLRAELGPDLDLTDAQTRYARLGDTRQVVLEMVRERLAAFQAGPAQFSVSGVYSQDVSANIAALREQLTRVASEAADGSPGVLVQHKTRPRRGR